MKIRFNNKRVPAIAMILVLLLSTVMFSACGKTLSETRKTGAEQQETETTKETAETGTESREETEETETKETEPTEEADTRTPGEIAENAMDNFLKKIAAGNYVMDFKDHVKVSVVSDDLVTYEFDNDHAIGLGDGVVYTEMAVMTVNDRESFCGYFGTEDEELIHFAGEGKAKDLTNNGTASLHVETRLLDYFLDDDVTDGNIWNVFTNDPENPFVFVGTDFNDVVRSTMQILGGVGPTIIQRMQDVYLEFEEEDVQTAHFRTSFSSGLTPVPDIDIVITFGNAEAEKRADAWMKNEDRTLPELKTAWNETDEMNLNAVFLPPYGLEAVPFPNFASYALTMDINRILSDEEVLIRDMKAKEEDIEAYGEQLVNEGFTKVDDGNGEIVYRKLLREDYQCYSSLTLDYDEGVNILAKKYYEFPEFENLEAVNKEITDHGYPELPEKDGITNVSGEDRASEMTESWLYFFNYDQGLYVTAEYESREEAESYLEAYQDLLTEAGFELDQGPEEEEDIEPYDPENSPEDEVKTGKKLGAPMALKALFDENNHLILKNQYGSKSFRYHFHDDGKTLFMLFKSEVYIPREEFLTRLQTIGYPVQIDFPEKIFENGKDIKRFQETMYGEKTEFDEMVYLKFEKGEEDAESSEGRAFLDRFFDEILVPEGFVMATPADDVGMNRTTVFYKDVEEDGALKRLIVGLTYQPDLVNVTLEFRVKNPEN